MDKQKLTRELDRVKYKFLQSKYALYGSLLCTLPVEWREDINLPTAANTGTAIYWNPEFFEKIKEDERLFVLAHELEHSIRLHSLRLGKRDPKIWNYACDVKINEHLISQGFKIPEKYITAKTFNINHSDDMAEEDIYDELINNAIKLPIIIDPLAGDMQGASDDPAEQQAQINQLVNAVERAKSINGHGDLPGELQKLIDDFTETKVPWNEILIQWCNKLSAKQTHLTKRNRRFRNVYVPGKRKIRNKMESIYCYFDVSGSMGEDELKIVNGNMKYIKDHFNPVMMKIICFDTRITSIIEFTESDEYTDLQIKGGGGTSLAPVKQHIENEEPELAIILSDLECRYIDKPDNNTSFVWLKIGDYGFNPKFGKVIKYDY